MFVLARDLHKTVAEIEDMSAREFEEWLIFYKLQKEELDLAENVEAARRGSHGRTR